MKLFMASLATETNSFSPIPTGWSGFHENLHTKEASRGEAGLYAAAVSIWRNRAETLGWDVVEGLSTYAQPAGPTVRAVYETMRDDILADLQAAMPVDVVLLSMHGAMIAQGYDDCEGDLLTRARAIVGDDATGWAGNRPPIATDRSNAGCRHSYHLLQRKPPYRRAKTGG